MISVQRIKSSADAARYHDSALQPEGPSHERADNYYANEQTVLTWEGNGAVLLGIDGQSVDKEQFVTLLEGKIENPATGEQQDLSVNSKGGQRRLGYDFTISAPKSVSIVGIVGGDERVIAAHVEANRSAMRWLEEHGAQIRVKGQDGENVFQPSGNLLYATVQHETSRANDPQLHNHNVIVAATYNHDKQKWHSLTNDELFQIRHWADTIYKVELARNLKEAGYEIARHGNGIDFEIKGIADHQLKAFSQRTAQIEEALRERGIDPDSASHKARQTAALATRARKTDMDRDYLLDIWTEKAREAGLNLTEVIEKSRKAGSQIGHESQQAMDGVTRAIKHLSEREQSFRVPELEEQAVFFSNGAGISAVKKAIDDRKEDRSLVDRLGQGMPTLTTSSAIANELTLQDSIRKGKGENIVVVNDREQFEVLLARFEAEKTASTGILYKLSVEQVNAARNILMHEDKFQGIQGDAGTGKTAALEFVQYVARENGWDVKGIATSTTGARELEQATGIGSQTVAAFLIERDERIKMLRSELRQLEVDFAHTPGTIPGVKRVAKRDLNMDDQGFAPGRYVFDSKSGEVQKATTDAWHPLNTLGIRLQEAGQARQGNGAELARQAERVQDRFKATVVQHFGRVQEAVGRSMISYEVVERTEAKAARAEHRQHNLQERERMRAYLTKTAQVENLLATGNAEGKRFLLVMDESSMTGAKDSARITEIARDMGARVVLQGDIKQHGSVSAGRAFLQAQQGGINLSRIEETRRFDNATAQQRMAIAEMKQGNFTAALQSLDKTLTPHLYGTAADRYIATRQELLAEGITDPKIGIVTIVNEDRKEANVAVHHALREAGVVTGPDIVKEHLDDPKLTEQQYQFVPSLAEEEVDRMVALRDYKSLGIERGEMLTVVDYNLNKNLLVVHTEAGRQLQIDPAKHSRFSFGRMEERSYAAGDTVEARANIGRSRDPGRIANGSRGTVVAIDEDGATIRWKDGKESNLTNAQLRQIDFAYAHTSHKEQGVTNDHEIFLVSETGAYWLNREASYVAASRAKNNTEIVTNDEAYSKMLENAGTMPSKTTALDIGTNLDTKKATIHEPAIEVHKEQQRERPGPELSL